MTRKVEHDGRMHEVPAFTVQDLIENRRRHAELYRNRNTTGLIEKDDRVGPEGRDLLTFPDGWRWVALDRGYCELEGKAGRHCGNVSPHPGDNIVSLRDPRGQVMATLVVNAGTLRECKGVSNQKLTPDKHPYLADLLLAPGPDPLPIKSIDFSSSYLSSNDTNIDDLLASRKLTEKKKVDLRQKFDQNFNGTKNDYIWDTAITMVYRGIYAFPVDKDPAKRIWWDSYLIPLHLIDSFINFFTKNWTLLFHTGRLIKVGFRFGSDQGGERIDRITPDEILTRLRDIEHFYKDINYSLILNPKFSKTYLDDPGRRETRDELVRVSGRLLRFLELETVVRRSLEAGRGS